jgi:multidrug efflux pump subunit AcrA (membrane-fusion protein)
MLPSHANGTIDFSDNSFDPTTGTLLIRGSFPNSDGFLTPGNFVRVRVASGPKYNGIIKVRPDSPVRPQQGAMEQFGSNDISMPLISSQSSASHAGSEGNQSTP